MKYKILAISGSLRASSANTHIVKAISGIAGDDIAVEVFNGIGDLPHFNPDIDGVHAADSVLRYRQKLRDADGVFICTPEYAFGMPGVLKNALDWVVASGEFMNKPVAAVSASPLVSGGSSAHASLVLTLKTISAIVPKAAMLNIAAVGKKIDAGGYITDAVTVNALREVLKALAASISLQKEADSLI